MPVSMIVNRVQLALKSLRVAVRGDILTEELGQIVRILLFRKTVIPIQKLRHPTSRGRAPAKSKNENLVALVKIENEKLECMLDVLFKSSAPATAEDPIGALQHLVRWSGIDVASSDTDVVVGDLRAS